MRSCTNKRVWPLLQITSLVAAPFLAACWHLAVVMSALTLAWYTWLLLSVSPSYIYYVVL